MNTISNYIPFNFQRDSVEVGVKLMSENGGLCIFDETGLGKTITSTMVVLNSVEDISKINLLVISPISNIPTWNNVLGNTIINYTVCNIEKLVSGNSYTHIIVDEAHNFRTLNSSKYITLFKQIHGQINRPDVILTTATPFNNNYSEIKYIFSLIPFKVNSIPYLMLGMIMIKIESTEKEIEKMLKNKKFIKNIMNENTNQENLNTKLDELLNELSECLSYFCIRTTREKIKNEYQEDMERMGAFPHLIEQDKIVVDDDLNEFISGVLMLLQKAPLCRQNVEFYNPRIFPFPKSHAPLFLNILGKRLDSSHYAFHKTLERTLEELYELRKYYEGAKSMSPQLWYGKREIEIAKKFWDDMYIDIDIFEKIRSFSLDYTKNAKYNNKAKKLVDIINEHDGKLVIFSEYTDTMEYLIDYINKNCDHKYIEFNSKINSKQIENIILDFDANVDATKQSNKYKFVIATDVLSEGISMHRANRLVHYDCRWNPSKIKQRNGRINRIVVGNMNPKKVYVDTFDVNPNIEAIIGLLDKIDTKNLKADTVLEFETNKNFKRSKYFNDTVGIIVPNLNSKICILHTPVRDIPIKYQVVTKNLNDTEFKIKILNEAIFDELNNMDSYDLHKIKEIKTDDNIEVIFKDKHNEFFNLLLILDKRPDFMQIKDNFGLHLGYIINYLYSSTYNRILNENSDKNIFQRIDSLKKYSQKIEDINMSFVYLHEHGSPFMGIRPKL